MQKLHFEECYDGLVPSRYSDMSLETTLAIGFGMVAGNAVSGAHEGAFKEITHQCLEEHKDQLRDLRDSTIQNVGEAVDEGWKRDYNAGGISSWGSQPETAS